jgi:hypothetical protein
MVPGYKAYLVEEKPTPLALRWAEIRVTARLNY